ncbi:hypothetical protein GGF32_009733 [Allomyces javanicus]|nr:hypothetical protein GGF32_009733 [Allomyces javanicus]
MSLAWVLSAWKKNAAIEKAEAHDGNGFIHAQSLYGQGPVAAVPGDAHGATTMSSTVHPIQLEQDPTAVHATATTDDGTWYADYHFADHSVTAHHVPADASGHAQHGADTVFVLPQVQWDGSSLAVPGHDQVTDVLAQLHNHPLDVSGVGHTADVLAQLADLSGHHSLDLSAIQAQAHAHHIDVEALLHSTLLF